MTPGKSWPCHDCQIRTPTCHGNCSKYNGEKQKYAEGAKPAKTRTTMLNDYIACSVEKTRGSKGYKIKNYRPTKGRG